MGEKRKTKYSSGQGVFFPGNTAKCWGSAGSLSLSPCPEPWDFTARCHLHPLKHRTPFRLRCERGRWCFLPQWWFFLAWQCPFWTFQILPPPQYLDAGWSQRCWVLFPTLALVTFWFPPVPVPSCLWHLCSDKGRHMSRGRAAMYSFRLFSSIIYHCISVPWFQLNIQEVFYFPSIQELFLMKDALFPFELTW